MQGVKIHVLTLMVTVTTDFHVALIPTDYSEEKYMNCNTSLQKELR